MIEIRIRIQNEDVDTIGVKEAFAYICEQLGDVSLIDVAKIEPEQLKLFDIPSNTRYWEK